MSDTNSQSNRPPILRDSIALSAEKVSDLASKQRRLMELLQPLRPEFSRAVVFVTSRRAAEDLAQRIQEELDLDVAPFHAGLPTETRVDTYERFRGGQLAVLCATNAFGMGMDIDNIHLIIHYGPPSSLEDYLQEVGRAARSDDSLRAAGLERATAVLLYGPGDFANMRVHLKKDHLSPLDVNELHRLLVKDRQREGAGPDAPISVELARYAALLRRGASTPTQVRIGLHWLEQLKRITVDFYTPVQVYVQLYPARISSVKPSLSLEAGRLLEHLAGLSSTHARPSVKSVLVREAQLEFGLSGPDHLFRILIELAKLDVTRFHRPLMLPLNEDRGQESRSCLVDRNWPFLQAALQAVVKLGQNLDESRDPDGLSTTMSEVKRTLETLATDPETVLTGKAFSWIAPEAQEEYAQRDRQCFTRKSPAILRLLSGLHIVSVREEVSTEGVLLHLKPARTEWLMWLDAVPHLVREILAYIIDHQVIRENGTGSSSANEDRSEGPPKERGEVDGQGLLLAADRVAQQCRLKHFSISHLQAILRFLVDLRYLERFDTFIPLALEVTVHDSDPIVMDESSHDWPVLQKFEDQKRLRMLRLAALEVVPHLSSNPERLRQFVERDYREVRSAEELLQLLQETLPPGDEVLGQLREDALKELVEGDPSDPSKSGLSDEQRAVYTAPLDRHLMVIAGPGAGKTHTLLARVIRLYLQEPQAQILVLAFTRAVVSELRHRLQTLLTRLGYSSWNRRIQVRTFHAFALETLRRHNLIGSKIDLDETDYIEKLEVHLSTNESLRNDIRNRYRYVLVDEFQDVYDHRYRLLEHLARQAGTFVLVVGDDDQSIYDYGRPPGDDDAGAYFKRFEGSFNPLRFDLTRNYRSAQAIVDFSQDLVQGLPGRLKASQRLMAHRPFEGSAAWQQTAADHDLPALVAQVETNLQQTEGRRSAHNTIAVLARTNDDVYRIKAVLQKQLGHRFTLLVQGDESRFDRRRDVAEILDILSTDDVAHLPVDRFLCERLESELTPPRYRYWTVGCKPKQHDLYRLATEYLREAVPNASIIDFAHYVREMSRDGNYLRVVARHRAAEAGPGHILLSTIHKVKGIEFPAVILLNSDLAARSTREVWEELRVMYVGMTRAEDVLVALKGEREARLLERQSFGTPLHHADGIVVPPSLRDVFLSKFGYEWDTQRVVHERVRSADPITIVRNEGMKNPFSIRHNPSGKYIGLLSGHSAVKSELTRSLLERYAGTKRFEGLEVVDVYRRYVQEDENTDSEKGTSFAKGLCPEVIKQGYYYVVEIGGVVKPT